MPSVTKWLAAPVLAPIIVLAMACGGGESEEDEVTKTANTILLTYFNVLSGKADGQALVDIYAPECRSGVDAEDIDGVIALVKVFAPEFSRLEIEEVDIGKLNIEKSGDEIRVTPADSGNIRVKVDGKFVNADDYFNSLSGTQTSADGSTTTTSTMSTIPGESTLTLVRQDGKLYVSTCEELQEFADF